MAIKAFCEVTLKDENGKLYQTRCCGKNLRDAELKLLHEYPNSKIVSSFVLEVYNEARYGWC